MHKSEPFQIDVNQGQYTFELLPETARQADLLAEGEHRFHFLHEGRSVHATLVAEDPVQKQYTFRIEGVLYTARISDHYARLVQQLGLSVGKQRQVNAVKAPMPGMVLSILVEPGQQVQKGDVLLILEAMKMENVLKAAGDGCVKSIAVSKGAAVEKGHLLIEMA